MIIPVEAALLFAVLLSLCFSSFTVSAQPLQGSPNTTYAGVNQVKVELNAAVIPANPFAFVSTSTTTSSNATTNTNTTTNTANITGYHRDLVEVLELYAAQRNITLKINLQVSPYLKYGDALDLVAIDCDSIKSSSTTTTTTANSTTNNSTQKATKKITFEIVSFASPQKEEEEIQVDECHQFDLILGDYYVSPERAARVNFLPPYIQSSISTIKVVGPKSQWNNQDYTLLEDAVRAQVPVCATDGTYAQKVAYQKFPNARWILCGPTMDECVDLLRNQTCVLYCADEHKLKARAVRDLSLQVTGEQLTQQFFVWPLSYRIKDSVYQLLKQLLYDAIEQQFLDELYYRYFEIQTCPLGAAGKNCQQRCHPDHGRANPLGLCVCESARWTGPDCATEVQEERNLIPQGIQIAGFFMFALNVVVACICAAFLYCYRNHVQVKLSQPFFLVLVLIGCITSTSTILPLLLVEHDNQHTHNDDDTTAANIACMATPWLYSVGFCVTFGTLFAKLRRVYIIFSSALNMQRVQVTVTETLSIVGGLVILDGIILTTWNILDPLTYTREILEQDIYGYTLESVGYCTCQHWKAFAGAIAALHFLLLITGCWYCYISRTVPQDFSDSKYVIMAMISNAQIFVIGVPVLIIVAATNPGTSAFVRSMIIFMNDFVVIILIFGNLMYNVYMTQIEETPKEVVERTIQEYRRSQSQRSLILSGDSEESKSTRFAHHRKNSSFGGGDLSKLNPVMEDNSSSEVFANGSSAQQFNIAQAVSEALSAEPSCEFKN